VSDHLGSWIHAYTDAIIAASEQTPPPTELVDNAKSTLLAIYSYAERLKEETARPVGKVLTARVLNEGALDTNDLALAYLSMQQNAPTVTGGGSCPVVRRSDGLPGDQPSFISNSDMLHALTQGQTLEDLTRHKTFPCPKCGYAIPSGEGKTSCPKCGITKEQYAKEIGGPSCD
jgi:predicted RNA-binding Zn-ribbon protein involved in translation (DUF1610 family)